MTTESMDRPVSRADLDALEAKLDYLVDRHEMLEDLVREFTPVVRDAIRVGGERLGDWEARGLFSVLGDLSERVVPLLETLRNLTEPDVLAAANEATDVLHHADGIRPIGMFGAVRATSDQDVQHGLAVALEVLRHLGRSRGSNVPIRVGPVHRVVEAPAASPAASPAPAAHAEPLVAPVAAPPTATVTWEGATFTSDGFLVDAGQWNEALAEKMGAALGLTLTDEHWQVVRWVREDYATTGASPNVRRTAVGSGVGTQKMYELFPRTPGKTAAMLAGVPKPVGCV